MKKITLNLLALLVSCCIWQVSAQTFPGADVSTVIIDNVVDGDCGETATNVNSAADASSLSGNIGTGVGDYTLDNVNLTVNHTWTDVDITLTSPMGTTLALVNGSGGTGTFTNVTFDDSAATTSSGASSTGGTFIPVGGTFASTFAGQPVSGNWTLNVAETFEGAGCGSLTDYSITFSEILPPPPAGASCASDDTMATLPVLIPAMMPGESISVTVTETQMGIIGEDTNQFEFVNAFFDTFQHDTANELVVTLTAPDGTTTVTLFANDGGADGLDLPQSFSIEDGGSDVNDWNDAASYNPPFEAEGGPFNGEIGGAFQGVEINGDWTLTITNGGNSGGSLNDFCLLFQDRGLVGTVPVISCPEAIPGMGPDGTLTVDNDPGQCGAVISFSDASAVDAEDGPLTVTRTDMTGLNSDDEFPVGTTVLTFEATDSDGNTVSCDFTVVVNDVDAPTVTCPDDITVGNDTGDCGAIVTVPAPVFMDNCPVDPADVTNDYNAGGADATDFYPLGTTTVTYSYTDSGANTITCSVDITVEDTEAPVIACEGAFTASPATVSVSPGAPIGPASSVDYTQTFDVSLDTTIEDLNVNLDINHTWTGDLEITLTSPMGTSVVIFDDGCRGDDLVMTLDDESPNVLAGNCVDVNPGQAFAEDNYQPTNPLAAFIGEPTMGTWTMFIDDQVGGDGGTVNTLGLVFSFDDSNPPTPFPVTLMADGTATIPAADLVVATDNCGPVTITAGGPAPTCASANPGPLDNGAGFLNVNIFANDFTVDPNTNFILRDMDVIFIAGNGVQFPSVDVTYYEDNAGIPGAQIGSETIVPTETERIPAPLGITAFDEIRYNLDVTDFTFANASTTDVATYWIGVTSVSTAGGNNGFFATNSLSVMGAFMQSSNDGGTTWTLTAAGPADGIYSFNGLCIDASADPTMVSFTCEDVGSNDVEITVVDDAGNVSTCTAVVEVTDDTAPELVCMDFTIELDDNGVATLDP
ncbi:proprotein convertase P-domain-containing protein, partial [Jejudonia soesokkakensis]